MKKQHKDSHSKPYKVRSHARLKSIVRAVSGVVIGLATGMVIYGLVAAVIQ